MVPSPARPPAKRSFGKKLNDLFETVKPNPADGDRKHRRKDSYSNDELAAFIEQYTGRSCSRKYIGDIREDRCPPPAQDFVEAIAVFFKVESVYFFNDALSVAMMDQLKRARELAELADQIAEGKVTDVRLRDIGVTDADDLPALFAAVQLLRERRGQLARPAEASESDDRR